MNQVWNIARKELSDGLRNRWLLAISLLFAVLAVGIAWLGAAASGQLGFTSIPATIASLASLATFLMPLIALLLAYDAIVGEDEGGTLMLLLTYPPLAHVASLREEGAWAALAMFAAWRFYHRASRSLGFGMLGVFLLLGALTYALHQWLGTRDLLITAVSVFTPV